MDANAGVRCGTCVHLWIGFFFDGCNDNLSPMGTRGVKQKEREASVAGNESEFHRAPGYFSTPRSELSMKLTRYATSSVSMPSSLSFWIAWVVFIFAASSKR